MYKPPIFNNFINCDLTIDKYYKSLVRRPGNYIVCVPKNAIFNNRFGHIEFKEIDGMAVYYVGKTNTSIRKRLHSNHVRGNAGNSTLRMSLGVLLGLKLKKLQNRDKWNFGKCENCLNKWIENNLRIYYFVNDDSTNFEKTLINYFDPPLNLRDTEDNSQNSEFRKTLKYLRNKSRVCNETCECALISQIKKTTI